MVARICKEMHTVRRERREGGGRRTKQGRQRIMGEQGYANAQTSAPSGNKGGPVPNAQTRPSAMCDRV